MVSVTTMLTFFVLITNIFFCKRKLKTKFYFNGIEWPLILEMGTFTFFIFINQIIDQINWSVDNFLIGRLLGTVAVALYGVGAQINMMYLQFSTAVSNVFVPKVNAIVAETDDSKQLTVLFTKVGRIQFIILSLVLSGFVFFGKAFIVFWAGNEYNESYFIALLLIAPVTVPLIQNLGIEIQRAKNKHKTRSIVYLCIAITNIIVSIPLIKIYGPIGAAVGTAGSLIAGNILFMNWYYHFHLGIDIKFFWKSILQIVPGLLIPIALGCVTMVLIQYESIVDLGVAIVIYAVVYSISMWYLGMNQDEHRVVLGLLKRSD